MASDLVKAAVETMKNGGDFEIAVYDADTDTQYDVSSVKFEVEPAGAPGSFEIGYMMLNVNETPEEANEDEPLWAVPVPEYGEQAS